MTANDGKTKKSLLFIACTIAVFAVLVVSITGSMAADKASQDEKVAAATVEFVNPDSGVILIGVDKAWKISGIDPGDEIEIVIAEETEETSQQQPRRFRMFRHPYGGPSDK